MSFAQAQEDAWILGQFPKDYVGYAAEIGAFDGLNGSITMMLEHAGWTVLCVEPNPKCEPSLKEYRNLYRICAAGTEDLEDQEFSLCDQSWATYSCLGKATGGPGWTPDPAWTFSTLKVPVRKLDTLLLEAKFPRLDALSVDTEGTELDVLKGLSWDIWKPKAVVVESWDDTSPVVQFMESKGYQRISRRCVNDLFLPCD